MCSSAGCSDAGERLGSDTHTLPATAFVDASTQTASESRSSHIDASTQCYYHRKPLPAASAATAPTAGADARGPTPLPQLVVLAPLLPASQCDSLYIRELLKTVGRRKNLEWLRYLFVMRAGRQLFEPLLDTSRGVEAWHRVVCIDWLSEVSAGFRLRHSTLSRCVALFDDALRRVKPKKQHLQRYAITSLVIAAKMEEPHSISVSDYADMTCGVCTTNDVLAAEVELLRSCGFDFMLPSIVDYIPSLLSLFDLKADVQTIMLCDYIAESVLYDPACSMLPAHFIAFAVVSIASGGKYDTYLTELSVYLFEEDWESVRGPVVSAFEECHVYDFKRTVKGNTSEVTLATKARHRRILAAGKAQESRRKRAHHECGTESSDFATAVSRVTTATTDDCVTVAATSDEGLMSRCDDASSDQDMKRRRKE